MNDRQMPVGNVVIVGRDDPPPWGDIADRTVNAKMIGHTRFALVEGGMTSGRTSVMIAFPTEGPNGAWVTIQTSLAMLEMVVAAAHGAEQRWAERD